MKQLVKRIFNISENSDGKRMGRIQYLVKDEEPESQPKSKLDPEKEVKPTTEAETGQKSKSQPKSEHKSKIQTFKEAMDDWVDFDVAEYLLAVCLGLIEDTDGAFSVKYKHIFWSNNVTGNILSDMLHLLGKMGALEFDEEESSWRWNKNFKVPEAKDFTDIK